MKNKLFVWIIAFVLIAGAMASIYKISTPIIAMNSFEFSNATITIPKEEYIDLVLYCANWNFMDNFCSRWDDYVGNIHQNDSYVTFTINRFSAYAGVSKVSKNQNASEIAIKIIDSKKTVLQEIKLNKSEFSIGIFDEKKQGKAKKSLKETAETEQLPIKINFKDVLENISIQMDMPDDELIAKGIKTEIISILPENKEIIAESEITLEKINNSENINRIFYCSSWNQDTFKCSSQWQSTSINFVDNSTHITFNVTHFTAYAGGYLSESNTSNLMIWDNSESLTIYSNNMFYANYSNSTSNISINSSGTYCEFSENSTGVWSQTQNMTFNSTSGLYYYNKSTIAGTYYFNVSCFNDLGYDNLSAVDNFSITSSCAGATSNFICEQTITESCAMTGSLVCANTGFNIGANNIIVNGNGFSLNYSASATYFGINNTAGYDNITIQNFNIYQTGTSSLSYGIYMYTSENSTIQNNNISTRGNYAYDIYLFTNNHGNRILNNNIYSNSTGSWEYGVYLASNCDDNIIDNNYFNATTASSHSIFLNTNCDRNNITNNRMILTNWNDVRGIYLTTTLYNNTIINNTITTNYYGVVISGSYNTNISNNYITTNGQAGIYITTGQNTTCDNNTIIQNSIGHGLILVSSPKNVLINNKINSSRSNSIWIDASVLNEIPSADYANYNQSIDESNTAEGLPILFNYSLKNQIVLQNTNVTDIYGQIICAGCKNVTYDNVIMGSDGINFFGTRDSTISNSLINTNKGYGITLFTNSYNNTIFNNTLIETGSVYYLYRLYVVGNSNNIVYNNLTTSGLNYAGILISSYGNYLANNTISATGSGRYAIQIGGKGNAFDSNIFKTSGGGNAHPIVDSGGENIYRNNQILVLGTTSHGTYITSADSIYINNTFNNSISGGYSAFTFGNNAHRNRIINSTFITASVTNVDLYSAGFLDNNSIENSIFISTTGLNINAEANTKGNLNIINCSTFNISKVAFASTSNITTKIQSWNELIVNYSNGSLVAGAKINYTDETNTLKTYFTGGDLPYNKEANDVLNMSGNILYLKFNELNGVSQIIDYSGTQNATFSNISFESEGIRNRTGIRIAGSNSTTKRWVDIGNNSVYNITTNLTVIIAVKYADQIQWCELFTKGYDSSWAFKGTTVPNWRLQLTTNGDKQISFGATAVNRWYVLAGTYNGTSMNAYRDGILVANANYADTLKTTTRRLMIGMASYGNDLGNIYPSYPNCDVWVGEALIFNRTLSADEIKAHYESTKKNYDGEGESIGMTNISMNRTANTTIINFTMTAYKNGSSVEKLVNPFENLLTVFTFDSYSNVPPAIENVLLNATTTQNRTVDNLTVYYNSTDADTTSNFTDWRKNGESIALLNLPFDNNISSFESGAIIDYSTYSNNLTIVNGTNNILPAWTESGKIGGAYNFGFGVLFGPASGSLNITGNKLTLEAWIKPEGENAYTMVMGKEYNYKIDFNVSHYNEIRFITSDNWTEAGALSSNSSLSLNQWYHIAAVYDGSEKRIYINGVLDASKKARGNMIPSTDNFTIGRGPISWEFNGLIDEVKVYNISLSEKQIVENYNAGLASHSNDIIVADETRDGEIWSVLVGVCDYEFCTTQLSNNVTITNTTPSTPLLHLPENGISILSRIPALIWNNSIDPNEDNLTYELLVSNDSYFDNIVYNLTNIAETATQTNSTLSEVAYSYLDKKLYWKARAFDGLSYGDYSEIWNFTVLSVISATLSQDNVSFGMMNQLQEKDTLTNDPEPFVIENNGNVKLNISLNATDLHEQAPNPSEYYQYEIAENESGSYESALTSWTNFELNPLTSLFGFKYLDESDSAKIHLKIKVPSGEYAGNKTSIITMTATLDE